MTGARILPALPVAITRRQLTEAFRILGIDANRLAPEAVLTRDTLIIEAVLHDETNTSIPGNSATLTHTVHIPIVDKHDEPDTPASAGRPATGHPGHGATGPGYAELSATIKRINVDLETNIRTAGRIIQEP